MITVVNLAHDPKLTVCTLVTRWTEYATMRASFIGCGFTDEIVDYLVIDNSQRNQADAYQAINLFLLEARSDHIVLCHQDVELVDDGWAELWRRVAELDRLDPAWGIIGNAGSSLDGRRVMRLTDPHGTDQRPTGLPEKVSAVDENFMLVRAAANLAVSRDLSGFHHYGHDLCIIADILGWSCYVVDFHMLHKSNGSIDQSFERSRTAIAAKYQRAFRPRWIAGTTQRAYRIGGGRSVQGMAYSWLAAARLWRRLARRLKLPHARRDALEAARPPR